MGKKKNKKGYVFNRDNIKLSFGTSGENAPKYFVNPEKKKVTCVLTAELLIPDCEYTGNNLYSYLPYVPGKKIKVSAAAKCSDKDEFDVNRGMHIALAKAEIAAYDAAFNYIVEQAMPFIDIADMATKFLDKAVYCVRHNTEHVEVLSDKENPNYNKDLKPIHAIVTTKVKKG